MENLSPLSQYYLRKLLNQDIEQIASAHQPGQASRRSPAKILEEIKAKVLEASSKRELETLIHHYNNLETQLAYQNETLIDVKRRIFRLLGVGLISLANSEIPTVVQEQSVSLFRFLQQGRMREGIFFGTDVYGMARHYNLIQRRQAYQTAWALTEQKVPFVLTASETRYAIWVSLRSPAYKVLLSQGVEVLDRVVSLYSILAAFKDTVMIGV